MATEKYYKRKLQHFLDEEEADKQKHEKKVQKNKLPQHTHNRKRAKPKSKLTQRSTNIQSTDLNRWQIEPVTPNKNDVLKHFFQTRISVSPSSSETSLTKSPKKSNPSQIPQDKKGGPNCRISQSNVGVGRHHLYNIKIKRNKTRDNWNISCIEAGKLSKKIQENVTENKVNGSRKATFSVTQPDVNTEEASENVLQDYDSYNNDKEIFTDIVDDNESNDAVLDANTFLNYCNDGTVDLTDTVIEFPKFPQTDIINIDSTSDESNTDISELESKTIDCLPQDTHNTSVVHLQDPKHIRYHYVDGAIVVEFLNYKKLYLHGIVSVAVLYGTVNIFGHCLNRSSQTVNIISPRGSSFLYLEPQQHVNDEITREGIVAALQKDFDVKVEELCQSLSLCTAVVLFKKHDISEARYIEKHIAQQIFPKCEINMPQCIFQQDDCETNVLKNNEAWDTIISNVNSLSKVFLCGGKGVGKSTFLRYMINKLLSRFSKILIIDLDPGQPEFTLPGCLSACIVDVPVFGPNYSHLRKPYRSVFMPHININYDPDQYNWATYHLLSSCADLPEMPTLVNFMGYTRDLGLDLVASAIFQVQPTIVVQIESNKFPQRNFSQHLNIELVEEKAKTFNEKVNTFCFYELIVVESMTDEIEGWNLTPRQAREMCVLSYFAQMLPPNTLSLTSKNVPIFVVDLSSITLMNGKEKASAEIVNANLVALCSVDDVYEKTSEKCYNCHGWGIVRGINIETDELYLLTPLLEDELEKVDHLILGSVFLPPSMQMTSDGIEGVVPYISEGVLTSFGKIPKRSYLSAKQNKH